jgi:hypothetical protein
VVNTEGAFSEIYIEKSRGWGKRPIAVLHYSGEASRDKMRADARLIAAAPCLLEACKGIVDCCDYYVPDGKLENVCRVTKEFSALLDKVAKAVARAEGREM